MNLKIVLAGTIFIAVTVVLFFLVLPEPNAVESMEWKTIESQPEKVIELKFPENYKVIELENNKRKISLIKPEDNFIVNIYNPYPTLELLKWGDTNFSISLMEVYPEEPTLIIDGNKIIYSNPWFDEVFYEIEGGYEYEVILKQRPNKNYITFDVNTENLNFFYQAPLNETDINPEFDCNATQCTDVNGLIQVYRPENIVGSYAVYHATEKNNEYKTGKAFHIYKPHVVDSDGTEEYCDIYYDEVDTTITITCDRKFIRDAVYPITIDPTFGNTAEGSTDFLVNANQVRHSRFLMGGTGGTADDMWFYIALQGAAPLMGGAIYEQTGAIPDALLGASSDRNTGNNWSVMWYSVSMSSEELDADTDYWLSFFPDGTSYMRYDDSNGQAQGHWADAWPPSDPASCCWNGNGQFVSIYVNFSTAGPPVTSCDDYAVDVNWTIIDECFFVDQNINLGVGKLSVDCDGVVGLDNAFIITSYLYYNVELCATESNPVRRKNGGDVILTPN